MQFCQFSIMPPIDTLSPAEILSRAREERVVWQKLNKEIGNEGVQLNGEAIIAAAERIWALPFRKQRSILKMCSV